MGDNVDRIRESSEDAQREKRKERDHEGRGCARCCRCGVTDTGSKKGDKILGGTGRGLAAAEGGPIHWGTDLWKKLGSNCEGLVVCHVRRQKSNYTYDDDEANVASPSLLLSLELRRRRHAFVVAAVRV